MNIKNKIYEKVFDEVWDECFSSVDDQIHAEMWNYLYYNGTHHFINIIFEHI